MLREHTGKKHREASAHLAFNNSLVGEILDAAAGLVVAHRVVNPAANAVGEERALAVLVNAQEQNVEQLQDTSSAVNA